MTNREQPLRLRGWSGPGTPAHGDWRDFDLATRLRRSLAALGLGLGVALLMVPVPVVHFAAVPAALLAGALGAVEQLAMRERLMAVEGECPHCGAAGRYRLGVGVRRVRLPADVECPSCGRRVSVEAAGG